MFGIFGKYRISTRIKIKFAKFEFKWEMLIVFRLVGTRYKCPAKVVMETWMANQEWETMGQWIQMIYLMFTAMWRKLRVWIIIPISITKAQLTLDFLGKFQYIYIWELKNYNNNISAIINLNIFDYEIQ